MPRLFMNVRECGELLEDLEGEDFSSIEEAKAEAVKSARELMVHSKKTFKDTSFEIADESGQVLHVLRFLDAV